MPDAPNGLASMTQARERRARRVMPPPRHPVPAGNAEPIDAEPNQSIAGSTQSSPIAAETPTEPVQAANHQSAAATKPHKRAKPAATTKPAEIEPVREQAPPRPATLYLDNNLLEFLEEARIAGLLSRPRLDISKSAVVRLALRRLQQDMTINEIRDHLRAQPTDPTKTGRKRR